MVMLHHVFMLRYCLFHKFIPFLQVRVHCCLYQALLTLVLHFCKQLL